MIHVYNKKNEEHVSDNVFYIGRPSIVGNPFTHHKDKKTLAEYVVDSIDEAIDKYETWIREEYVLNSEVKEFINNIKDKSLVEDVYLGCWCSPNPCHGKIIKDFINELLLKEKLNKLCNKKNNGN